MLTCHKRTLHSPPAKTKLVGSLEAMRMEAMSQGQGEIGSHLSMIAMGLLLGKWEDDPGKLGLSESKWKQSVLRYVIDQRS
jgi:hypothetical protein